MTNLPPLGPAERRLLLSFGRLTMDPATPSEVGRFLAQPLEWDAVLFHARLHSVSSILYHHLDRLDLWELVPEPSRLELLRLWHRASYQNRIFAHENAVLLGTFREHGVRPIVQKGISLVERIYGKPALRPLIDLVFLIRPEDTREAIAALCRSGYQERQPPAREMLYRWCCPQRCFVAQRDVGVAVLLQTDLVNWPRLHRFSSALLWNRAEPTTLGGRPALVLSPVDQLLYLCLQADNHGSFNRVALRSAEPADLLFAGWSNNRLIRFTDIYEVARRLERESDWETLVARAREGAIEEPVCTSLTLANRLLGQVAEPALLERLRVEGRNRLRRWLYRAIAQTDEGSEGGLDGRVRRLWNGLPPRSQLQVGRVIGLLEYCFPEATRLRVRYGIGSRGLFPPLYVAHAARGVFRSAMAYGGRQLSNFVQRVRGAVVRRVAWAHRLSARA